MKFISKLLNQHHPELYSHLFRLFAKKGELSGYEIASHLQRISMTFRKSGLLSIYPMLYELERAKLLESHWRQMENSPANKYYRLTRRGQKYLKETYVGQ